MESYYQRNKERLREYYKKYRAEHKEQYKEYSRTSYEKYKEAYRERSKKWYKEHPNYRHDYYMQNKDKAKASMQNWRANNKKRWTELCNNNRKKRVDRLKAQGCVNVWAVINGGAEPIFSQE
jgi:glycerophosphoryl diester phosphodiesterase